MKWTSVNLENGTCVLFSTSSPISSSSAWSGLHCSAATGVMIVAPYCVVISVAGVGGSGRELHDEPVREGAVVRDHPGHPERPAQSVLAQEGHGDLRDLHQ